METQLLSCVEIEPKVAARATVIWLHGLGADGHDFEPIVPELQLPREWGVRFVFPHAPSIPVTINGGFVMPAWYDILGMDLTSKQDEEGIRRSAQQVTDLISRENERGIPSEHIMLVGFSQGGAIALHVGLRHPESLAGIAALSTYQVLADKLPAEAHEANRETKIFQAHGTQDPMVLLNRGTAARDSLQSAGYKLEWHEYPMQHQVCMEELNDLSAFFERQWETKLTD